MNLNVQGGDHDEQGTELAAMKTCSSQFQSVSSVVTRSLFTVRSFDEESLADKAPRSKLLTTMHRASAFVARAHASLK